MSFGPSATAAAVLALERRLKHIDGLVIELLEKRNIEKALDSLP